MRFYLKKRESPAVAVARINLELRARIIRIINDESFDPDTLVHELRKCIKKLRAVLRFSKPGMKAAAFKRRDRALRNFAREVSGTRDSAVLVNTFDCLADHYRPFLNSEELLPVRQALQSRHVQSMAAFQEQHNARELESAFISLEMKIDRKARIKVTNDMMKSAVRDIYARGRKLHQLLDEDPDTENSHSLRRQAKYLWYQLRMLKKRMPESMRVVVDELDELGELLGDDNDMSVLIETLRKKPGLCCNRVQAELLCSLAETRRISLLSAALRLSGKIYAGQPDQFVERLFAAA
jgi:CHAD domain-containing protein